MPRPSLAISGRIEQPFHDCLVGVVGWILLKLGDFIVAGGKSCQIEIDTSDERTRCGGWIRDQLMLRKAFDHIEVDRVSDILLVEVAVTFGNRIGLQQGLQRPPVVSGSVG